MAKKEWKPTGIKVVKINRDRGYGPGLWQVETMDDEHYTLRSLETGKVAHLFQFHCFTDRDTMRKEMAIKREIAAKVGR